MHKNWDPKKTINEEFKRQLTYYICQVEKRPARTVTDVTNGLMRNGIYTYEEMKDRVEHSKKVKWYDDLYKFGYVKARIIENFINFKENKPVKIDTDEETRLKNQIRELQSKLREIQRKNIRYNGAWYGVQRYSSTRPDEYYIAIEKLPVEYDLQIKDSNIPKTIKVVVTNDKDKVLERLDIIIEDLIGLRDKLRSDSQ